MSLRRFTDSLEENLIAITLGIMTLLTFYNVVARYVFNSGLLWALEVTVFLFGWLVLLGAAYAVKKRAHIGVDAITNAVSPPVRKTLALIAGVVCIAYAFLLSKGAWDYWANFANLPATEGRWFPEGFQEKFRAKGWYETEDTPMPNIYGFEPLKWMEAAFNDGEEYEKVPRLLPYLVLPISMFLLLYRFIVATIGIWRGEITSLIASHEVEDAVEEAAEKLKDV